MLNKSNKYSSQVNSAISKEKIQNFIDNVVKQKQDILNQFNENQKQIILKNVSDSITKEVDYKILQDLMCNLVLQYETNIKPSLHKEIKEELRPNVESELRQQLTPNIETELRQQLRPTIEAELRQQLRPTLEAELRQQLRPTLEAELRQQLRPTLESELRQQLKPDVEAELRQQLKPYVEAELREEFKPSLQKGVKQNNKNNKNVMFSNPFNNTSNGEFKITKNMVKGFVNSTLLSTSNETNEKV